MDDIRGFKEFTIKSCREWVLLLLFKERSPRQSSPSELLLPPPPRPRPDRCQFSNGGDRFAAVNGAYIQVYDMYSCEQIASLRGHNGKVFSLHWSPDDSVLLSAGKDGAIYRWDLEKNVREVEKVVKGVHYSE